MTAMAQKKYPAEAYEEPSTETPERTADLRVGNVRLVLRGIKVRKLKVDRILFCDNQSWDQDYDGDEELPRQLFALVADAPNADADSDSSPGGGVLIEGLEFEGDIEVAYLQHPPKTDEKVGG